MIISVAITVTAKTLASSPERQEIKIGKGTLTRVSFDVPPGSNGEVYLRLLHLENSLIPDTNDQWVPVTGNLYEFNPNFNDWKGVYKVTLEGCAPQARYPHTIEVLLEIEEQATLTQLFSSLLKMGSNG